jgi:hypothetical protein
MHAASGQLLEDGAARRVGQGLEDVVLGHGDTLATTYFKCKRPMANVTDKACSRKSGSAGELVG